MYSLGLISSPATKSFLQKVIYNICVQLHVQSSTICNTQKLKAISVCAAEQAQKNKRQLKLPVKALIFLNGILL